MGVIGVILFMLVIGYGTVKLVRVLKRPTSNRQYLVIAGIPAMLLVVLLAGHTAYPRQMVPIALLFWMSLGVWVGFFAKNGAAIGSAGLGRGIAVLLIPIGMYLIG